MTKNILGRLARLEFAPPRYLTLPTAGIDISANGVRLAVLEERLHGLELTQYGEAKIPLMAMEGGDLTDRLAVVEAVRSLVREHGVRFANIALPESRSYLFEASAPDTPEVWRTAIEQHLDEYVPLPPAEVAFDVLRVGASAGSACLIGVGYAHRVIEETLSVFDEVGVQVRAVESEMFSVSRALLAKGDKETVLIIDIGRTTTKIAIVTNRIPRFATTLDVGGHALTVAIQKHFGGTEQEARRVKEEKGIVHTETDGEYIDAMLPTVSVIREEIARRLDYWQSKAANGSVHEPVVRALLVGTNATVRGLPEYLETTLGIPVELADVFRNLTPREHWLPPIDYRDSLAYATAIGLALREHDD